MSRISLSLTGEGAALAVHGNFTFDTNREFRDAYRKVPANKPITVDLSKTDYIDSAGLGMLIRLRDHAGGNPNSVRLIGANDTIMTILEVVNFGRLFTLG